MEKTPPHAPTPPPVPAKKAMPAIAWVGIGCGLLLLLAIIAGTVLFSRVAGVFGDFAKNPEKAGAEMIVSLNPDLEMVSQDEGKGEMTVRTKDGKEMTLSYKDIAEGKLTMADAEGNETVIGSGDLSRVPSWVPKPSDFTGGVSTFHTETSGQVSGQFSGKSLQSAEDLAAFFESSASGEGMTSSSKASSTLNGTSTTTLEFSNGGKSLVVVITGKSGSPSFVNTTYSEK